MKDRGSIASDVQVEKPPNTESSGLKILLTGADGYIGAIMAPYLLARKHDVTGSMYDFIGRAGSTMTRSRGLAW